MNDKADPNAVTVNGQTSLKDRVRELQLSGQLGGGTGPKHGATTTWLPWMLCILMALAWAGVGIRSYKNTSNAPPAQPEATAPVKTISGTGQTAAVGEIVLESKGYLIPSHQISVSPIDVAGRIILLNIEEGLTFKKGDILAAIDSTRFEADLMESEAMLAGGRAKLTELEKSTKLEIDQADYELKEAYAQMAEAKVVYETNKTTGNAIAKVDLTQAEEKYNASRQHVEVLKTKLAIVMGEPRKQKIISAERDLEAAQARYNRSKWSYDNCTIRSPVTGVILTKKAEIGSLINPVVGGVSTSLCEIADLSQIEVDLEIQERDIAKIRVGMVCRIRPDAYSERVYDGFVDRMMPIANRARGIIPVRVRVVFPAKEEQGKYLKPEMGVSVTFINKDVDPAVKAAAGEPSGIVNPAPAASTPANDTKTMNEPAKQDLPVTKPEPSK